MSEDVTVGWHHQCNGHELGQTPGDGEGQGGLECCSPWVAKNHIYQVTEQQQQRLIAYFLMCDNDMVIKENVLVCKVCMLMYAGLKCHGV